MRASKIFESHQNFGASIFLATNQYWKFYDYSDGEQGFSFCLQGGQGEEGEVEGEGEEGREVVGIGNTAMVVEVEEGEEEGKGVEEGRKEGGVDRTHTVEEISSTTIHRHRSIVRNQCIMIFCKMMMMMANTMIF